MSALTKADIKGAKKISSGKVREIFEAGSDSLMMVTTDRISAFDVIMTDPIPDKGKILNMISIFWFDMVKDIIPNHILESRIDKYPEPFKNDKSLEGRSMLVKKAKPLPVECIVRGYISGSGWKDYKKSGAISGIKLPENLKESDRLPEPIFTPSTKADLGSHDEAIDFEQASNMIGAELAAKVRDVTIAIYKKASEHALKKGIIIADTKFEFGMTDGGLIIIDEALTPDSSRFWPVDLYAPGKSQPSFDKQFLRDYLETLDWGKTPPAPKLPQDVIDKTREKYVEAYEKLTGKKFE